MKESRNEIQIKKKPALIAVIGAGGKTSAMLQLARSAAAQRILLTTTTHIFPVKSPVSHTVLIDPTEEQLMQALLRTGIVCAGTSDRGGKLAALPQELFAQAVECADLTLCEADGAHCLPLKLHTPDEPVIPAQTDCCLIVAGLSALGKPVGEVIHRYERNPLWREHPETIIGAEQVLYCIGETIRAAQLPERDIHILLNQADTAELRAQAAPIQAALCARGLDCRTGSLHDDTPFLAGWLLE